MSVALWWWVLAAAVVVAELLTGSVYLLMVALGLGAGAVAAHLDAGVSVQIALAAVIGGAATAYWHFMQVKKRPAAPDALANKDVNLDVGETVQVDAWNADGRAQVRYRGSLWQGELASGARAAAGDFRITQVSGNRLTLANV
jgi:membrane protein implicated in regulation of membrane protease activity